MKKTKLLSILLLLALLMSLPLPALAVESDAADSAADSSDTSAAGTSDDAGTSAADITSASAPTHAVQATSAMLIELSSGQVLRAGLQKTRLAQRQWHGAHRRRSD